MTKFITKKNIAYTIVSLIIFSFFYGFYSNENSVGAGGYNGDIIWILENIEIFKNNSLKDSILNENLFGNRTPLIYVINELINPFFYEYEKYRVSIFLLSLIGPIILYLCLRIRFPQTNKDLIILLSSLILLSPYYRTSAYWALNENYGLISSITSFLFLNLYLKKIKIILLRNIYLLSTILFSSMSVYFDQKLLIVTMICFFYIVYSNIEIKHKFFVFLTYILLGLPYLFLIFEWNGIVPPKTQAANVNTITNISRFKDFYTYHLGYVSTIIGFYIFPFLFLKNKNFFKIIQDFLKNKKNIIIIIIPIFYILYMYLNINFKSFTVDNYWIGLGIVKKTADIFFSDINNKEIFTYFIFFLSWIVIFLYIEEITDFLILSFFFLLSLIIWPLMQEYFDPIIVLLILVIFKTKITINLNNVLFLIFYFSTFLIIANIYYLNSV